MKNKLIFGLLIGFILLSGCVKQDYSDLQERENLQELKINNLKNKCISICESHDYIIEEITINIEYNLVTSNEVCYCKDKDGGIWTFAM